MKLPNKVMDIVEEIHKKQQKENDFIWTYPQASKY